MTLDNHHHQVNDEEPLDFPRMRLNEKRQAFEAAIADLFAIIDRRPGLDPDRSISTRILDYVFELREQLEELQESMLKGSDQEGA